MGLLDLDFEPFQSFEEYQARFKKHYAINRRDGIIEVRMADEEGNCTPWYPEHKHGWAPLLDAVGADKDNQILILGGSGEKWNKEMPIEYMLKVRKAGAESPQEMGDFMMATWRDVPRMFQSLLWSVDVPTIGVINGPADGHMELALMCDIVICADNVEFSDIHFVNHAVPGDGMYYVLEKTVGTTRANYLAITGEKFNAQQAFEWGLVGEVVPPEQCYHRAWEIAEKMMKESAPTRVLTHEIMRSGWREFFDRKLRSQVSAETLAGFYSWGKLSSTKF